MLFRDFRKFAFDFRLSRCKAENVMQLIRISFLVQFKLWKCSDFVSVMYVTLRQCKGGLWT